ncbi:MAG: DNA polymerase subunit beta [Ignavibacteria bacterium CG22_combo_CG10-13_8_21_14_all_37_15]|nr:MAG: DNA polymerase subunit beta [Ignavibacteria bacterium CG22_combo_CG10-13_8_21_14_all_37_15]PJC61038.1 MAG: DNA polymerase subunit beta [Ignavibacteria bacterium CG_4_9_14_0_2_um_filter_37_13]
MANIVDTNLANILKILEQRLITIFGLKLKKIILYGSYARGDYNNESDVDILMVIDEEQLSSYNTLLSQIELEFFSKYNLLFSIITENENYFVINAARLPFFKNVNEEGVLIYG